MALVTLSSHVEDSAHAKDGAVCPTDDEALLPKRAEPKKVLDKQSLDYIIRSGVAGGLAGCAAKTIVGPLDRVKILFQASSPQFAKYTGSWFGVVKAMKDIHKTNGTRGLFRGHSATLLRIFPYAGIKFLAYEQVRAVLIQDKSQETPVRRFLSGSIAGSLSVFFTYPLEVIRVRLAFDTNRQGTGSLVAICRKIYYEQPPPPAPAQLNISPNAPRMATAAVEAAATTIHDLTPHTGLANFYRGFTPTMWGMLPYAGTSFLAHDYAKDLLRSPRFADYTVIPGSEKKSQDPNKPAQLKSWAQLTAGGVAGFFSQTISYPLEVIRRRMQVGGVVGDGHRLRMAEVAGQIWRTSGFKGFYVGLTIGYVKMVPMTATSFFVYERSKYYLGI